MEKFRTYVESLSETVVITKKEQTFMLAIAALAGCVIGMLISPHRASISGDNSVMNNYTYYGKKKQGEKED